MSTFTSSLPDDLLQSLAQKAKELSVPKNTLIERALPDLQMLAEEGMADYLSQLSEE